MHSEPEANVYRDEANRVIVVTDGITKHQFSPEQWRVICMAANWDLLMRVDNLQRLIAIREIADGLRT